MVWEIPLSMVAWMSVILFHAIVHFGIIGPRIRQRKEQQQQEEKQKVDKHDDCDQHHEQQQSMIHTRQEEEEDEEEKREEQDENDWGTPTPTRPEEEKYYLNDFDDDIASLRIILRLQSMEVDDELDDESSVMEHLLSQTGNELLRTCKSQNMLIRRIRDQLSHDEVVHAPIRAQ